MAWAFALNAGSQAPYSDGGVNRFKWAFVQDGDVYAVPEPQALAMMLAGLAAIGFLVRRRKR